MNVPIRWVIALMFLVGFSWGCSQFQAPEVDPNAVPDADHPKALERYFSGLVEAAQKNDTKALQAGFQKLLMTRADFATLFPPKTADTLWEGYQKTIIKDVQTQAADVLSERVKKGFTKVRYERVGPTNHKETTRGDYALLKAMKTPVQMYSFRFVPKTNETLGLRLNGLVFVNQTWKGLFKSSQFLTKTEGQTSH